MLEVADQFALDHGEDRQDAEDHSEDDDRLGDHDPGRFGELRVPEGQQVDHAVTSASFSIPTRTWWPFSRLLALAPGVASAREQTASGVRSLIREVASRLRSPRVTRTLPQMARPRRWASSGESSRCWD